tara:strand:+ start:892 stop:1869 length:978 start_codon:yes stop_codon:yes gene_type:complete
MGLEKLNKNIKAATKKLTPSLPPDSKFIFKELLKNSSYIEENLDKETMLEYNVGDLKKVVRNLNEAKKCTYSFECKGGKICLKGRCKKNPHEKIVSPGTNHAFKHINKTELKETDTTYCKKRKLGKCCDGGDGHKCGKWVEDPANKKCTCSYQGPCCNGQSGSSSKDVEQEMGEATTSSSSGAYSTPKFWAKEWKKHNTKKKKSSKSSKSKSSKRKSSSNKRWMPGAKFVKVKDKCKKFPYCNQGDINALEIWEKEIMRESAKNVAKKIGKPESEVREMIEKELAEVIRRSFYKSPIKDLVGGGKMNTPIGKMFTMKGNKPKYES